MINSVSGVSFRGDIPSNAELINSPGQFSSAPEYQPDSFEKEGLGEENKSSSGKKGLIGTALVALASFVGLGYAVKIGKLKEFKMPDDAGFFTKIRGYAQNAVHKVGEWGEACWNKIAGWFGKSEKAAEGAAE